MHLVAGDRFATVQPSALGSTPLSNRQHYLLNLVDG
jgi:hypothetical protein